MRSEYIRISRVARNVGLFHAGNPRGGVTMDQTVESGAANVETRRDLVAGFWGVRYQVKDVARAVAFYTQQLGLTLDQQRLPAFAQVSVEGLKLILSGPGASGSRPMPNGGHQEPGGWNRVILRVADLPA